MASSPSDPSDDSYDKMHLVALDGRLKSLLEAIEDERAPERLLKLARELQGELSLRKQRGNPN